MYLTKTHHVFQLLSWSQISISVSFERFIILLLAQTHQMCLRVGGSRWVSRGSLFSCAVNSARVSNLLLLLSIWTSSVSSAAFTRSLSPQSSARLFILIHSYLPPTTITLLLRIPDDEPLGPLPVWPYSDQWETVCEQPRLPSCPLNNSYECAETPGFEVCNIWSMGNPHAQWHWGTMWPQFCVSQEGHCRLQIL